MLTREKGGDQSPVSEGKQKQRIVLLHLDLGVGGAERLMVDAALALKSQGHTVQFVTTHHDSDHCFPETSDGTLQVTTVCDWLPRSVLGRFYAVCSYVRMIIAAVYVVWFSDIVPDVIIADQVSACLPVLKRSGARVVFYCHFPDMMLSQRGGFLKRLYRRPIDALEEWSTGKADTVLINSKFTGEVFRKVFRKLSHVPLQVVHPTASLSRLDRPLEGSLEDLGIHPQGAVFLSLNRYERKKNVELALLALETARQDIPVHLVVAGGYDPNCRENVEHFRELQTLAQVLQLDDHVSFLRSPSENVKQLLLHSCRAIVYTPSEEHFGIVPLEAMYMRKPVVACNSGGPTETVSDGETGFLCEPTPESFGAAMVRLARDRSLAQEMGISGRERVVALFSWERFVRELVRAVL